MISKADLILIIVFSATIKPMRKTIRTRNSKIFKSNFYFFTFMHKNSSFFRENVFVIILLYFQRSCCLYHFNVTKSVKNKGEIVMKLFDWIKKKKEIPQQTSSSVSETTAFSFEAQQPEQTQQSSPTQQSQTQQEHDAAIRLYACRKDTSVIASVFEIAFAEQLTKIDFLNNNEFVMTLTDDTFVQARITSNPQESMAQAYHIANFFNKAPLKNKILKENILQQMKLFNCIVTLKFVINSDEKRTDFIIQNVYTVAKALTAFVLVPTMELFHYDGRLLIDAEGNSAFDTFSPIASADFLDYGKNPSPSDIARKEKSIAVLKEKKIPYLEKLPSTALEADTTLQQKEDIIKRLIATYATCIQSEIYTNENYKEPQKKMEEQMAILEEKYHVSQYFSPQEKHYIEHPPIEQPQLFHSYGWRYECCAVFLWALSLLELKEPNEICEALQLGNIIWNHNFESLLEAAKLRSKEEILDLQDLTLRYDWACVDARIHDKTIDALDFGVIYERHYALNWLLNVDGISDWDNIVTNT